MELKHCNTQRASGAHPTLLIVPYGIETRLREMLRAWNCCLLIVPYGIETVNSLKVKCFIILLIVPYGIETKS